MTTPLAKIVLLGLITAASCFAAAGCSTAEKRAAEYNARIGGTYNDSYRVAARIDPRKGIGEFEAHVLASAYFFAHINGCGGTSLPKDRGDVWVAESVQGYAGIPGPQVIVEKRAGVTYSPGRKKVRDPKEYLKFIEKITVI